MMILGLCIPEREYKTGRTGVFSTAMVGNCYMKSMYLHNIAARYACFIDGRARKVN